ncbi:MAG: DUF975 family protein [Actinomycetes bacterium]|jgi:hypothetical protein|nr:DUF975 family protein [Actinomycetes bacterium]
MLARAELKGQAKRAFAAQRPPLILGWIVVLIVSMLVGLPMQLNNRALMRDYPQMLEKSFDPSNTPEQVKEMWNDWAESYSTHTASTAALGLSLLSILLGAITFVVEIGYYRMALDAYDGKTTAVAVVFGRFREFGRWIGLYFLSMIKIALWSMLFIIPGIIAALNYSQAAYLMLDDPELGPVEAIRKSCALMRGHKGQYFVLALSFIGWMLLESITFGLSGLYSEPYMNITYAGYYRELAADAALFAGSAPATPVGGVDSASGPDAGTPLTANVIDVEVNSAGERELSAQAVPAAQPAPAPTPEDGETPG